MSTMLLPNIQVLSENDLRTGSLQVVVDRSILEAYLNGGLQSGTMTFYPTYALDTVVLKTTATDGRVKVDVQLQELNAKLME
jgi:beta-fructofuranosidase